MYAQLGDIKFELITYFNGLTETSSYNYAEHERIENKPILQYIGENLTEQTLKLNFHRNFCVPEDEIQTLKEAAQNAIPLKYIKGNGDYVGVFVIEEISDTVEQTTSEGDILSIQLELKLKEYTGKVPDDDDEEQKGFKKKE